MLFFVSFFSFLSLYIPFLYTNIALFINCFVTPTKAYNTLTHTCFQLKCICVDCIGRNDAAASAASSSAQAAESAQAVLQCLWYLIRPKCSLMSWLQNTWKLGLLCQPIIFTHGHVASQYCDQAKSYSYYCLRFEWLSSMKERAVKVSMYGRENSLVDNFQQTWEELFREIVNTWFDLSCDAVIALIMGFGLVFVGSFITNLEFLAHLSKCKCLLCFPEPPNFTVV